MLKSGELSGDWKEARGKYRVDVGDGYDSRRDKAGVLHFRLKDSK